MCAPMIEDVLERFNAALDMLQNRDSYLLAMDVSERAITHKLGEHLQQLFPVMHVDCEYNRNGHDPKRVGLTRGPRGDREARIYPM
jgi:hypothetical protein